MHWLELARALARSHEVIPILWSGDAATVAESAREYDRLVPVVGIDAACGRAFRESGWPQSALDAKALQALAPDEAIGLAMMDRMDAGRFGHDARRRHWHLLLRQWAAALDALADDRRLGDYQPWWAARADLLARAGRAAEAAEAYARAIGLETDPAVRHFLTDRSRTHTD